MEPNLDAQGADQVRHGAYGSWKLDLETDQCEWSPELYEIFGVDPAAFQPTLQSGLGLVHPDDRDLVETAIERARGAGTPLWLEFRIIRPNGVERVLEIRAAPVADKDGTRRLIGTLEDASGRRSDREQLWILANHDPLTTVFNRRRFLEELEREVAVAARTGVSGAVLILDLDCFKDVNDSLGHHAGDELLTRVASLLKGRLRTTDTLGRLGGDEFAVVLPGCPPDQAELVAVDLLEMIRAGASVALGGRERLVLTSIGVAPFGAPEEGRSAAQLLVQADLAMYRAKAEGGDRHAVFDERMKADLARRVSDEDALRDGIDRGQFLLHYQPLTALADGSVVGCEALIRWQRSEHDLVAPADFIPLAEETGLINPIGAWVIAEACRQAAQWRRRGGNLTISINVSPRQLIEQDVVSLLRRQLQATGLPAPAVTLEITETSLLGEADRLVPALIELRALGVQIAIDDFGKGASSLSSLRLLPIDSIKIDRLFVDGLPDHSDDRAIVAAVISLAVEMGLSVVAEGVETVAQHGVLRELGCAYGQGFLYSRPVPADEIDPQGYVPGVWAGVGDPSIVREFMRQIGIPARIE